MEEKKKNTTLRVNEIDNLKNKEKESKSVARMVTNSLQSYNNYNNNKYINLSIYDDNVEVAAVTGVVTELPYKQYLSPERSPGSIPGRSASTLENKASTEPTSFNLTNRNGKNLIIDYSNNIYRISNNKNLTRKNSFSEANNKINAKSKTRYKTEWRFFKDVTYEDEILTLNATSGETERQKSTEKQEFGHNNEEMFRIETDNGNLVVSPEHKVYVKLIQYNNNGVSFNVSVVGSTSKPSVCKTTTPSNTLSTKSEIQILKGPSLPLSFIQASPLDIFIIPAPVLTFSSLTALIPSSSANFFGRTVKLAPVSTKALTTLECFFSKSLISISTDVCPMIYKNGEEYINLSDFKLTRISDIYNNLDNNKQPIFLDEKGDKIKVNKISKEPYSGKIYDVTVPNHIILVKKRSLERMGKGKRGLKYILVLHHNGAKTRGIKNGKRRN